MPVSNQIAKSLKTRLKAATLPKSAAGRNIITKVPTVSPDKTIFEIRERLPELAKSQESIDYFYVVNKTGSLVGVLSIKELAQHPAEALVKEVMQKKLVVSHPRVDQERVAHLALKHNIKAIPIVDERNHLLGVVPSDKILSILYQEYREDILHSAGIIPLPSSFDNLLEQSVWHSFLIRAPWIIVGLLGGVLAAQIIGFFEGTLKSNIILAAFIPLIVYVSDAVGTQTQTLFVRDIALNPKLPVFTYTLKQIFTTTLIGLICGLLVHTLVVIFWRSSFLGFVIGLSTFTAIFASTFIATFIPYLLYSSHQDPAIGSGPFATILQDLLSLSIYFLIASFLLQLSPLS